MPTPEDLTIPDKLASITATKQAIRQAIVDKGVEVPDGTVFRDYAAKIGEIKTGTQVEMCTITVLSSSNSTLNGTLYNPDGTKQEFSLIAGMSTQVPVGSAIAYSQFGRSRYFDGYCHDISTHSVLYIYGDCSGYAYGGGGAG